MIAPIMGDLRNVEAGFETGLGGFSSIVTAKDGVVTSLRFVTPLETMVSFLCFSYINGVGTFEANRCHAAN